jgi:hypothetical protein
MCGAFALVACVAAGAHADDWNKRTYLTFSGPVQIPGATLPAGTYTFELANPDTTRHVIRVSAKDSGKPIALFMTIPQDRLDPPSDNLIMFSERPAGAAQAIQAWFYPGDRIGEEFVYPKSQALQIAKANKKGVLTTADSRNSNASESDRMSEMKSAPVGRVDESGRMTSDESRTAASTTAQTGTTAAATTTAPEPTTAPRSTTATPSTTASTRAARPITTPRARTNTAVGTSGANNSTSRRRELPRTGSNLVAVELLSGFALIAGLGVRRFRLAASQ